MPTQTNLFIDELYQQLELEMLMNIGKIIGNGNGVDEDDIDVKIIGTTAHVTSTDTHSFLWWGQGSIALNAVDK